MIGYDTSFDPPDPEAMFRAGYRFVVRYIALGSESKRLDRAEIASIRKAGLDLVLVAELGADSALAGRIAGSAHARKVTEDLAVLGLPKTSPVYFAIDFDARDTELDRVARYVDGAVSALGYSRVGVYGGKRVIDCLRARKACRYYWQTYAWSGGSWAPGVNIRQTRNGITSHGGTWDRCESMTTDYGAVEFDSAPTTEKDDEVTPEELLNTKISSPSLGVTWTVSDWLKKGENARREIAALRTQVAQVHRDLDTLIAAVRALSPPPPPAGRAAVATLREPVPAERANHVEE